MYDDPQNLHVGLVRGPSRPPSNNVSEAVSPAWTFMVTPEEGDGAFPDHTVHGTSVVGTAPKSPTKCLILIFKPGERLLKMLWLIIWPIFISDINVRIYRLHREKTAQSSCASPAHNQIQA